MSAVVNARREADLRLLRRNLTDCNSALQRLQAGSQRDQVSQEQHRLLEEIARIERLDDSALSQKYLPEANPEALAARTEAVAVNRAALNTAQANQWRKEQIWREVAEASAASQGRADLEREVYEARKAAADEAERRVRERHAAV